MPEAELHRLDPATATLAFGVRDGSAILPPAAAETAVAVDLPLPAEASAEFHCLVLVDRAPTRKAAPRRPLAHEVVRSTYRGGSERRTNPEYVALRQRLRDVEGGGDAGIMATGDPGLDLIGLIGGVVLNGMGAFSRAQNEAAARQRLAVTPATLATQSWEPYTFEVTTVEASRAGLLRAALVDRVSNLAWPIERNVVERRSFRVANGRRARDRGLLEGGGADLVETADLAVWEQGGLRPSLLAVAKQLAAVDIPGVPGGIAALARGGAATRSHRNHRPNRLGRAGRDSGRRAALPAARVGARHRGQGRALRAHQASATQPSKSAVPPTGVTNATGRGAPSACA